MTGELTTYDWCTTTGGALTAAQRRSLLPSILQGYLDVGRLLFTLPFGRPTGYVPFPAAPDSALTRAAVEAAADQGEHWLAHGFRTWLFGGALASADGVALDPELFHVAAIAHDAGLGSAVAGEDFTIRSADAAVAGFAGAGRTLTPDDDRRLRDGIVAHTTSGLGVDTSPIGFYLQVGALTDLAGLRIGDLPKDYVRRVYEAHPQPSSRRVFADAIAAEARAVPDGRFAQLHRMGFGLATRLSVTARY